MDDSDDLHAWARTLGLRILHAPGCPGAVFPRVGLLIDDAIQGDERRSRIVRLLRLASEKMAPREF